MADHDKLHGEEAIIALLAPLAEGFAGAFGLQDDCALLTPAPGTELVLETDPVAEGVHFLSSDAPEDVAWKALAVNVSDLAAKGAAPLAYLMALSFPAAPDRAWLTRFAAGLGEAQARFGCQLVGGDTDRRPGPLTITITAIGSVPAGTMVRRATARAGDLVFVSGTIGDAGLGLALRKDASLATAWGLSRAEAEELVARYVRPEPRLALGPTLRAHASAAMDISDGLVKDVGRMCKASDVAAHMAAADVPLSAAVRKVVARSPQMLARLLTAGDDYEVLAAVASGQAQALSAAATAAGVPVTRIGALSAGPARVEVTGPDGRKLALPRATGWDHF